jgi:hypothetical protein
MSDAVPFPSHPITKDKEPPLAPKGGEDAAAAPEPNGLASIPAKGKKPRKPRSFTDIDPANEPSLRIVYDAWPTEHPVTHEAVKKGPFAEAARAFQAILDSGEATVRELKSAGKIYASAEKYPQDMRDRIYKAWEYRNQAIMHVATFYGPQKRAYRQILPLVREMLAEFDAKLASEQAIHPAPAVEHESEPAIA